MDKEQAQQIIKAAFAIGGWSIPDSFDARSVAERLLPLDYVTAQDWIDTTIENGGDTRDFGRMIEQLRRLSGKTTVSEWAEKRESFFTRLGENDQMFRDIFGAAADMVQMYVDEKFAHYRYLSMKYPYTGPVENIEWYQTMKSMMMPAVGSRDPHLRSSVQNHVLAVLEVDGVWRDRILEFAKRPYGDQTKTIGRHISDTGEYYGMPKNVFGLLRNLADTLKV